MVAYLIFFGYDWEELTRILLMKSLTSGSAETSPSVVEPHTCDHIFHSLPETVLLLLKQIYICTEILLVLILQWLDSIYLT